MILNSTIVRAEIEVMGSHRGVEGHVLIDTGATYTLMDRNMCEEIGIKHTGRR